MAKDFVSYDELINGALKSVVSQTLQHVAEHGFTGPHHLYVSFQTGFPGVEIPDRLRSEYPDEMSIVIQHQYWGLEVEDSRFSITLNFNKMPERLVIPFDAITRFADPGVRFALQFQSSGAVPPGFAAETRPQAEDKAEDGAKDEPEEPEEKIVTLDSFRKK